MGGVKFRHFGKFTSGHFSHNLLQCVESKMQCAGRPTLEFLWDNGYFGHFIKD